MNNRIKELRKTVKLTQIEFGSRIGVKGNTVTGYENGLRSPSDAVIMCITSVWADITTKNSRCQHFCEKQG